MAKLAMMVKGMARPGKRDEVRRLFEEHLAPRATSNPAQEIVVWCADAAGPETFYLWEVYGDPAADGGERARSLVRPIHGCRRTSAGRGA